MNRYRNYMDRITAPASLHEKLLAGAPPRRQKTKYAPAFALARVSRERTVPSRQPVISAISAV